MKDQNENIFVCLGFDIWEAVESGYTTPSTPSPNAIGKKLYENDSRAKNVIMCGLVDSKLVKIMGCKSIKEK